MVDDRCVPADQSVGNVVDGRNGQPGNDDHRCPRDIHHSFLPYWATITFSFRLYRTRKRMSLPSGDFSATHSYAYTIS